MVEFLKNLFLERPSSPYSISIVALLDEAHQKILQDLWRELEQDFGVIHPYENPIPHITHIQATKINRRLLEEALEKFATMQEPYLVRTAGLGIFTGERLALYVPVVRNPLLTAVQTTLIATIAPALEGIADTHQLNHWLPHLTLIIPMPELTETVLAKVIQRLARRSFIWEIKISRFAVLGSGDSPFTVELKRGIE
jgi:hypothetical protein